MSRVARVVVPGFPHHITQRGNRHAPVFQTDADRYDYLAILRKYSAKHGLSIWAYCLMTNHVHLVAVPLAETSLALTLRDAHTVYAMHFNERAEVTGHVWQGRSYSCPLDETHLWAAVRYVERNPVRASLADHPEAYPWSSAPAHCGLAADPLLAAGFPPLNVIEDWAEWLAEPDSDEQAELVRRQTQTGRPCGSPSFISQLETMLKRPLQPQKRGPKPRSWKQ